MRMFAAISVVAFVASCSGSGGDPSKRQTTGARNVSGSGSAGGPRAARTWAVSDTIDPITDARVRQAVGSFASGRNTIEVRIMCSNENRLTYEFASFRENEGAPMNVSLDQNMQRQIRFQVRGDRGSARSVVSDAARFNNVARVSVDSSLIRAFGTSNVRDYLRGNPDIVRLWRFGQAFGDPGLELAHARRATARFSLLDGDATIQFDQTDPVVQSVITPCREPADRFADLVRSVEREQQAEQQARDLTDHADASDYRFSDHPLDNSGGESEIINSTDN